VHILVSNTGSGCQWTLVLESTVDDEQVAGVSALADPVRRSLFRYVCGRPASVSRDEAARAVGIQRPLAAHHLDRLVAAGLLDVEYRRLTGRDGPGAGRPAKLYRRSARELAVTIPPRRYDLAGRLLAEAVTEAAAGNAPVEATLADVARRTGRTFADEVATAAGTRPSRASLRRAVVAVLTSQGYEPHTDDREQGIVLTNCPFHALATDFRNLVCGMNLRVVEELVDGVGSRVGLEARLDPAPGRCCVTLAPPTR
jgi:predicted ArsR family transcriptional regulator